MKIAVYYPWVYLKSGCERTMVEFLRRSRHRVTIFTNHFDADATFSDLRLMDVRELPRVSVRRSFLQVIRAAIQLLAQKLPLNDYDLLMVFCEGLGDFVVFRNLGVPTVCLCFTPLRAAFDPHYQAAYLRMHGNRWTRRLLLKFAAATFRVLDRIAWKRYDRVFAISNEVRCRIIAGGLCPANSVEVIHPGVNFEQSQLSGVYHKRFLIPGRIMWTKNIELGIHAFLDLLERRPDLSAFELVIAGFVDQKSRPYLARLRQLSASCPRIRFVLSPSDEELTALYRDSYTVLYTPFNEDWGLVPIEAMCHGKPVISVNQGGPTEIILNGETGFLVPPEASSFSGAMARLADDPELVVTMGNKGREHCQRFSWDVFVGKLDASLEQLLVADSS